MRWLLSLATALSCVFACRAQDVDLATAKAKAALALARLNRGTSPMSDAKVKAAAAFKKCQEVREATCLSDLSEAIILANKTGRPLFVWVGMTCTEQPEIRAAFKDAVHVHATSLNGSAEPRLLVRPPGGNRLATPIFRRDLSPTSVPAINAILTAPRASPGYNQPPDTRFYRRDAISTNC